MNEQLQPLKKPTKTGKTRTGTQDDIVYAHIFDAILEQRLAPGTKLSEEALGEIFGVSRTIIRRALSRLAHEGVVLLRPNRSEEHTSELQSLMRISYAVFCLKKKPISYTQTRDHTTTK